MQNYIKGIKYLPQALTEGEAFKINFYDRMQIDPNHPSYKDHKETFSIEGYKYPYMPLYLGQHEMDISNVNVNCLRMLIRANCSYLPICLPKECLFAKDFIIAQVNYHRHFYRTNADCFLHLTIRTTEKECWYANSQTWHVDGFQGGRVARHLPEQDVIWSNVNPTEFLLQPFYLDGFDSSKHDINAYFAKHGQDRMAYSGVENGVYMITPYNLHRVANKPFTEKRVFIRLNFSPVEIQDPTNTVNPMIKREYHARVDVRNFLREYQIDETVNNGFRPL